DQLWKELKKDIAANRQYSTIDEAADYAEAWIKHLTPCQAFQKSGLFS
ncbi:MAG: integrase, partial [Pedosphaera sp.]|nr:integrase [Pedosphaera sp.]